MERKDFEGLPDDCLIEIFKFLDKEDLIAMAYTSSRNRSLARSAFPRKYRECFEIDGRESLRGIFLFGDLAKLIVMENLNYNEEIMKEVLSIFAGSHNLKASTMRCYEPWLEMLLRKLKVLSFSGYEPYFHLIQNHSCLVVLDTFWSDDELLNKLKVPTLKYIRLNGDIADPNAFSKFALNNSQLLGLQLEVTSTPLAMTGFKYLINLKELALRLVLPNSYLYVSIPSYVRAVQQLHDNVYREIACVKTLEALYLIRGSHYTKSLVKINQIKQLRIEYLYMYDADNEFSESTETFMGDISKNMTNLENFYVDAGDFDVQYIRTMVNIRRVRIFDHMNIYYEELVEMCNSQNRQLIIPTSVPQLLRQLLGDYYTQNSHIVEITIDKTCESFVERAIKGYIEIDD